VPNEIRLYGVIGEDVKAIDVKSALDAMDQTQPLVVRIHSEGGAVADGLAIYDAFKAYTGPKKAIIESAAFSIASHIAMAFENVEITENGYLMIHNPHMDAGGDDAAHYQAAEILSKLKASMVTAYSQKTGKTADEILAVMAKDTWINANDALAAGYVNRIIGAKQVRAVAKTMQIPQSVITSLCGDDVSKPVKERKKMTTEAPVAATLAEIKAVYPKASAEFLVKCIEKQLPVASVLSEALAAMDEELTKCKAQIAAMEAEAMEISVEPTEEETPAEAKAKARTGVKPVAKATGGSVGKPSASVQWQAAIDAAMPKAKSKAQAVSMANRNHPGLREQYLAEVNG